MISKKLFSDNDKFIYTYSKDKTVRLWDARGNEIAVYKHLVNVTSATLNSNSTRIFTSSEDGIIRVILLLPVLTDGSKIIKYINQHKTIVYGSSKKYEYNGINLEQLRKIMDPEADSAVVSLYNSKAFDQDRNELKAMAQNDSFAPENLPPALKFVKTNYLKIYRR